jgi:hypothetical protein
MLDVVGVREFDERVYRALLADANLPVPAIATAVSATPNRVQQAVTRLVSLGLVRRERPGRYSPVNPRTALLGLLSRQRADAETAFTAAQGAVEELADVYRAGRLRGDPTGLVEVVSGRDEVNRRVDELTRAVRTHLWVFDRPPYLEWADGQPDTNETELAVTVRMIEQGVDIRSVYCPESMQRPGRFETVMRLTTLGEQSRMLPSLPFKLRIMDRRTALVSLVGNSYDSLAIVRASGLLDALIELFEVYWAKAVPIGGTRPATVDTPDEEDLLVLRMLNAGLKDDAVARQLGVSPRTANRRIAAIMTLLGTGTRFQAGVEAARRGWL